MNDERYYQGIKRVQVLEDIGAVNQCLQVGWTILRVPDISTQTMEPGGKTYIVSRPMFILGWSGPLEGAEKKAEQQSSPESKDVDVPASLEWKAYSKGPGSWIFSNAKGAENLAAALRDAKEHTLIIEEWKYKLQGPTE